MSKHLKHFELWGTIGGLALGYRTIRYYQDRNKKIDLLETGLFTCVGYVVGEALPIVAPIIVVAVVFEEVQRQSRPGLLLENVKEIIKDTPKD